MEERLARLAGEGGRPGGLVGLGAHSEELSLWLEGLVRRSSSGAGEAPGGGALVRARRRRGRAAPPGGVFLILVHGPASCGKRTLVRGCLEGAGFATHSSDQSLRGAALFDSTRSFCRSSVSGVHRMMAGAGGVRGKAVLLGDCAASGKFSAGALVDCLRADAEKSRPPWPIVVVSTLQAAPGKGSDLSRRADATLALPHPRADRCAARLIELFGGVGGLPEEDIRRACLSARGGGMVASLTQAHAPRVLTKWKAPPMYAGYFDRVAWALRECSLPPAAETYSAVQAAISSEPSLAALVLRDTDAPRPAPAPAPAPARGPAPGPGPRAGTKASADRKKTPDAGDPLLAARRRLRYMKMSDGVERFRGPEPMASEVATAAFEGMALLTAPDAALSFPASYSVASARSSRMQRLAATPPAGSVASGDDPRPCCRATARAAAARCLDGALLGAPRSRRAPPATRTGASDKGAAA